MFVSHAELDMQATGNKDSRGSRQRASKDKGRAGMEYTARGTGPEVGCGGQ